MPGRRRRPGRLTATRVASRADQGHHRRTNERGRHRASTRAGLCGLPVSQGDDLKKQSAERAAEAKTRRAAPLATPTDLKAAATKDIAPAMNAILADVFALYLKTKNFHWHMSGPHFRDYHLLLDE